MNDEFWDQDNDQMLLKKLTQIEFINFQKYQTNIYWARQFNNGFQIINEMHIIEKFPDPFVKCSF